MLGGLDPILLFTFYKNSQDVTDSKIPYANDLGLNRLALPPIPIYLSELATGVYIDSEDKSIDIETNIETLRTSSEGLFSQKGIGSTVSITMKANKNSLGLTLLSAVADLILAKVTSKEYSVAYLHGAVTIFNGLVHEFSINQTADTDLYEIKLTLMRAPDTASSIAVIPGTNGSSILNGAGVMTGVTTPGGAAASLPSTSLPVQAPVGIGGAGT